jgi:hypothetical protein
MNELLKRAMDAVYGTHGGPRVKREQTPQEKGNERFVSALLKSRPPSSAARRAAALRG